MAAQRAKGLVTPRENLPCVGLVSNVPHDAVARRVKHAHESERQLHCAKRRGEMPAVLAHHLEDPRADIVRQVPELLGWHRLHFGGRHFATSRASPFRFSNNSVVEFCPKFRTGGYPHS